jgi:hypothetical protein
MDIRFKDCATEVIVMSTKIGSTLTNSKNLVLAIGFLAIGFSSALLAAPENAASESESKARSSISTHSIRGGRDNPSVSKETVEEYGALATVGVRDAAKTRGGQFKTGLGTTQSQSASFDFWFYDVDVVLFNDDDNDGYFHGIDLLFDVDTNFISADVYAVLYLSLDGGPWNECAETETFTIFGTSATDEYGLVTELMAGYPTGSYDILVELFDDYDNAFLTSFGPDETSALAFLPLEDFEFDAPIVPAQVVVNHGHGGGGAMDSWFLSAFILLLLSSGFRRIWIHRNDALVRIDTPPSGWQDHAEHQNRFKQ